MKASSLLGSTAAAIGFFLTSFGNPVPALGHDLAFEGEGDMDQRKLAPSMATMQSVDPAGGEPVSPHGQRTTGRLLDFAPVGENMLADRATGAVETDDYVEDVGTDHEEDGTVEEGVIVPVIDPATADATGSCSRDDVVPVENGNKADFAPAVGPIAASLAGNNGEEQKHADRIGQAPTLLDPTTAAVPTAHAPECVQTIGAGPIFCDPLLTWPPWLGDDTADTDDDSSSDASATDVALKTAAGHADNNSDNAPVDADIPDDRFDEDGDVVDSSSVFVSLAEGGDGSVFEASPADGDPRGTSNTHGADSSSISTSGMSNNNNIGRMETGISHDADSSGTSISNDEINNNNDIDRMETSISHGADSSGTSILTAAIITHRTLRREAGSTQRPSMPFLPNMKRRHRNAYTSSIRVGEVLTRPNSVQSADGSATLSLSADASIMMMCSNVCPTITYGKPVTCPTPLVGDGESNDDDEEEKASVLLLASARKLRRAKQKTARKHARQGRSGGTRGGNNQPREGRIGKFMGFFGHIGDGEGVAASAVHIEKGETIENLVNASMSATAAAASDEGESETKTTVHGDDSAVKGRRKAGRGWFRCRRGKKERNADELLEGEVSMTVSDIGGVEVTYDDMKVLSKSGPCKWEWVNRASRFPWGRTVSDQYELRVVDEGFDVCLGEAKVWGMTARPSFPETDES